MHLQSRKNLDQGVSWNVNEQNVERARNRLVKPLTFGGCWLTEHNPGYVNSLTSLMVLLS